jgi:excisionase family DNA binding protein
MPGNRVQTLGAAPKSCFEGYKVPWRKAIMARHELISTAQAARRLGVSPNTVRNYVANGQLTAIRVGPKLL